MVTRVLHRTGNRHNGQDDRAKNDEWVDPRHCSTGSQSDQSCHQCARKPHIECAESDQLFTVNTAVAVLRQESPCQSIGRQDENGTQQSQNNRHCPHECQIPASARRHAGAYASDQAILTAKPA